MQRYKLTIEYDGSRFYGWQRQPDFVSVQQTIEDAIHAFCGETAEAYGAGRTDAGVHALGMVAHTDIAKPTNCFTFMEALNFYLRDSGISILSVDEMPADWHARFSATQRRYRYRILNRRAPEVLTEGRVWRVPQELDTSAMKAAGKLLLGTHDFTSFRSVDCQSKSPVKTLDSLEITQYGEELHIDIAAKSFLYNQVRIMVGTIVAVGKGKQPAEWVTTLLQTPDRTQAGATAPACGLYFVNVEY